MNRPAFRFDLNRCTGCAACQLACIIENELPYDRSWRQVTDINAAGYPGSPAYHLSIACNHCETAVCMQACPALAYARDERTGAILIDADKCVGCNYCAWVCPYDAPSLNPQTGVMEKCNFCAPRLNDGREPACVTSCPTDALQMGRTDGGYNQHGVRGFSEAGLGPALELVALAEGRECPRMELDPATQALLERTGLPSVRAPRGIGLRTEWPLLLLTWFAPALWGLTAAHPLGGAAVNPFAFAGVGLLLMMLAALHLGRKQRAWRALLGWRTSWLSREVLSWSAYVGTGFLYLIVGASALWSVPVLLLGAAALLSMDRLYAAVNAGRGPRFPSSSTVLSGALFAGLFGELHVLVFGALVCKLLLYLTHKAKAARQSRSLRPRLAALRIALGFAVPGLALMGWSAGLGMLLIPSVLVAEFLDRIEFYLDLQL